MPSAQGVVAGRCPDDFVLGFRRQAYARARARVGAAGFRDAAAAAEGTTVAAADTTVAADDLLGAV